MAVQVVTGDELFARMVIRLLEGEGIAAVHSSRKSGSFERAVVDLDYVDSPRLGGRCVTVSASPAAGADLTRPFLVEHLIRLARSAFAEGAPSPLPSGGRGGDSVRTADLPNPADSVPSGKSGRFEPPLLTQSGVRMDGFETPLTDRERALYALLLARRGQPVSREEIRQAVFPGSQGNEPDVYVSYLRAKLDYAVGRRIIRTVRGKGYVID